MKPLPLSTRLSLVGWLLLSGLFVAAAAAGPVAGDKKSGQGQSQGLLTLNQATNSFDFDTEQMEGSIRLDGAYHGVTRLLDKRTGRQVIDQRYSALNLFKLHSVNGCMGQPRDMKRTIQVAGAWVEVKWAATEAHKGEITARYEVRPPNAVEVTVTVRSQGTYPGYEVFMSSYFDKVLKPHVYLQPHSRSPLTPPSPEVVVPTVNEVFRGTVLVFPRDAHAARRCLDGRWDRSEFNNPTVQMCPVRRYGHCAAFMAAPDRKLAVVLMSHPRHCYAISTRYHADNEAERLTSYSAFDLSLFGDDLVPGDQRTVKVRLALTALDDDLAQPLNLYRAFLAESQEQPNPPRSNWKGKEP